MHLKTRHNFPGESTLDPAYFSRLQWLLAPPPPPPPHSKFGSVILAYRQQLQFPHPSIVVAKWRGWGMLKSYHLYIPSVFFFVCLPLFVCLFFKSLFYNLFLLIFNILPVTCECTEVR